ncbi:YdeI/OmpD-associated family protein [Brevundimonas sp.]|uniref:YdeI/OmpD-associated family protein n=1 Tax=Brevundimonas sp. TaxID=1871086 RepID=UPI003D6CD293
MPEMRTDLAMLAFSSAEVLRAWLETHHATSPGIWIKFAKPAAGAPSVSKSEAIDVALCFGWIDGQLAPLDDKWWLTRFTPRKARSKWSAINVKRAEALVAAGRMRPAGQAQIDAARADGRWDAAYAPASSAATPDDLAAALAKNPKARAFFETLSGANRYAILYRLQDAKRPETRQRRLETFVAMLEAGETLH